MKHRNRFAATLLAVTLATGGAVAVAAPAQAASTMWSHGSSYASCQAAVKKSVTSWRSQGYQTSTPTNCAPNPYRAGWWRASYSISR